MLFFSCFSFAHLVGQLGCRDNDLHASPTIAADVFAFDPATQTKYFLVRTKGSVDDFPKELLPVSIDGEVGSHMPLAVPGQVNGMVVLANSTLLLFCIEPYQNASTGSFDFATYLVNATTGRVTPGPRLQNEPLFVNYQWIERGTDPVTNDEVIYVLMGDENAPYAL